MSTQNYARFRAISIILVVVACWGVATGRPQLHTPGFWIAVAFAVVWVLTFFRSQSARSSYATAVGFAASVAATLAYPSLGTLLMVSVGWTGARMSWRSLQIFGLPLVLFASLVMIAAGRISGALLHARLEMVFSEPFLSLLITFGVVALLGRFAIDAWPAWCAARIAQPGTLRASRIRSRIKESMC